jgi:beta-N-acetylhexosaminidase
MWYMKKYFFALILVLFGIYLFGIPDFYSERDKAKALKELLSTMSDAELLGQAFFLGYEGSKPPNYILNWISKKGLGGIKLFTRNVDDLVSVSSDIRTMQKKAYSSRLKIPLFIATDQEGGWVRQIKGNMLTVPGNLALGADGIPFDAYKTAYYIGCELAILGININFAPTVDVYSNPNNSVIGPRSFSQDPATTGVLALAYVKGMEDSGVICTAKHYPGHGDADLDSHGFLPVVSATYETLWDRELVPYRFLVKEGVNAIMTGHLAFPKIVGDLTPSSLSGYFITTILKEKLGFKGIVITDDLQMYGARQDGATIQDISYRAIMAGTDMILISHSPQEQEQTWNKLLSQMRSNPRFKARVVDAAKRIIELKLRFLRKDMRSPVFPEPEKVIERISGIQESQSTDFVFQNVCRAVTLIRDKMIPYTVKKGEKLLIVGQYRSFLDMGLVRFPGAKTCEYSYSPPSYSISRDREKIKKLASSFDTIIFCLANKNSLEILETLRSLGKKIIVISTLTPVYLNETPWIETAIAVYGTGEDSFAAGFAVLAGDYSASGRLPVMLDELTQ